MRAPQALALVAPCPNAGQRRRPLRSGRATDLALPRAVTVHGEGLTCGAARGAAAEALRRPHRRDRWHFGLPVLDAHRTSANLVGTPHSARGARREEESVQRCALRVDYFVAHRGLRSASLAATYGIRTARDTRRARRSRSRGCAIPTINQCARSRPRIDQPRRSSTTREQAIELGSQRRATAFIDLADATPERDTPTGLLERGAKAAGLAPRASARAAERAAATVRRSHAGPVKRGKTTSVEERAVASAILKALVAAKVEDARCDAVATRPGRPAKLRIEIPIGATQALARALAKGKAPG